VKELAIILGEAALSEMDKVYLKFSDEFEDKFVRQSEYEKRKIQDTLDIGWKLLSVFPKSELKRIREEFLTKHYKK
jgi:V/A-type H+-transporting ATPase subunit B